MAMQGQAALVFKKKVLKNWGKKKNGKGIFFLEVTVLVSRLQECLIH
jgi:hypothetical protein